MTAQLSPQRIGRITASRVGAILGVNKYQTRADVLREMVRQALGAEPEFVGNAATEHGNRHEEAARAEYERATGQLVLDAQEFVIHPEFAWLGVSPDGLLDSDGMVEIKCPWRGSYRSIAEKPEYAAQIQLQLACTGRAWCDFIIWRSFDAADRLGVEPLIIERVDADPEWLPANLVTLAEFHAEYERIVADDKLAALFLAPLERTDDEWTHWSGVFLGASAAVTEASERRDQARDKLIELAAGRSQTGGGVRVTVTDRTGSVDWKKVVEKYAPDADPEEFRKAASTVTTVAAL